MNLEVLNKLLTLDENENIEFKRAENTFSSEKLFEYTIALANEGGGKLILGVSDKYPREIIGTHAYEDGLNKVKEQLIAKSMLRIDVEELQTLHGRVLVFDIPSRPIGMPLHIDGRYLMRAGEALVPMSADMLQKIFNEAGIDFSAEICADAIIEDLDINAIEDFRKRWIKKSGNQKIADLSVSQLLSDAELLNNGKLNYAALILFGTNKALGRYLAQSEVIFEYRTTELSGPTQQRIEYRQGFFSFYDALWSTIDLRNTNQHYQDGLFIWDIKTFNELAIREALLNAVSHRDYRLGGSVFVRQYPEKIEIENPGGLAKGLTFENILWKQFPRNRRIAEVFAKCGLVERSGQGMNRIFETCISESKSTPNFSKSDEYSFFMTLNGVLKHPEFLKTLDKIRNERNEAFNADDLIVLQAVFDNKQVDEIFNEIVQKLFEEGLLEKAPKLSGSKWILARKFYSAIGKAGVHTRKKGLDRETNKALLLKHIQSSEPNGAILADLRQVLPFMSRSSVQVLLRELKKSKVIICVGSTKSARWFVNGCN